MTGLTKVGVFVSAHTWRTLSAQSAHTSARVEGVETATQLVHRLTSVLSFDPDQVWDVPVDDPRVVRDLETNDLTRLPWFFKRYPDTLPRLSLPRDLPATTAPTIAVLAGTADVGEGQLDLA